MTRNIVTAHDYSQWTIHATHKKITAVVSGNEINSLQRKKKPFALPEI